MSEPRHYRRSQFVRLFALIAVWLVLVHGEAEAQRVVCPKKPITHHFSVDGITGAVVDTGLTCPLLVGDKVVVTVHRANPLHYAFTVSTDSVFTLVRGYGVIGEGTRTTPGGSTPIQESLSSTLATRVWSGGTLPIPDATISTVPTPRELFLAKIAARLVGLTEALNPLEDARVEAMKQVDLHVRSVVSQDGNLLGGSWTPGGLINGWPPEYDRASRSFVAELPRDSTALNSVRTKLDGVHRQFTDLRLEVAQYNATRRAEKEEAVSIADFARIYDSVLTRMQGTMEKAFQDLDDAGKRVARWTDVREMSGRPELVVTFPVVRSNTRVYLKVARRPVSATARAALAEPPKADQPAPEVVLARLRYESHGEARYAMSVGFAGLWRGDASTYAPAPRLRDDGSLEHTIVQSASDDVTIQPIIQFQVFFRPVDDLDPKGRRMRYGLTIGAELSTAATRGYFLGLAGDHRAGFQLAGGVTLYQSTELSNGWEEGDVVPVKDDGSLRFATAPTRQARRPGIFLAVTFRPVIIGSLFKALGMSTAPGAG